MGINFSFLKNLQGVSVTGQGCSGLQDRNLVLVVDDDPGMLKGIQRLLRQHACKSVPFSSAQAFKDHTDFEKAVCIVLDINLRDGSGIELRHGLKAAGNHVPDHLHDREPQPCRSQSCAGLSMHRISYKAFLRAIAH